MVIFDQKDGTSVILRQKWSFLSRHSIRLKNDHFYAQNDASLGFLVKNDHFYGWAILGHFGLKYANLWKITDFLDFWGLNF